MGGNIMPNSEVTIHEVDTTRNREVRRFIRVPFKLYEDCPQWVPPIIPDARLQLNKEKNPYYKNNDAAFFLAKRDGDDVGRICVMHPRYYNDFKGLKHAFFYLFDSIDDQAVANALFDRAAEWATERGLEIFRGPLGFMAADGFGILARGFEYRPAVGIPYNYAYYVGLAENWGFELEERVYSGYVDVPRLRAEFPQRVLDMADKIKERYGFSVKTFKTKRELRHYVAPRLADVYNRALTHIAGDPPLSQEEVDLVAQNLIMIADPELIKLIEKDGELIGFVFCFNDITRGIQKAKGRLFPFGLIHILRDFNRTTSLNLNGAGILPEYQGMGGSALMYGELYRSIMKYPRFKEAEAIQISEFNMKILNEMKRFGVEFHKTHHIYRKALA